MCALEEARDARAVRPLSHPPETGYTIFETPDHRFVMHLGHPEYETPRLLQEWQRDRNQGRTDVGPPRIFDLGAPANVWRSHCTSFFSQWLSTIASLGGRR